MQGCVGPFKLGHCAWFPTVQPVPSLILRLVELIDNCQQPNKMASKWQPNGQKRHLANVPHMPPNFWGTHFHTTFQLNGHVGSDFHFDPGKWENVCKPTLSPVVKLQNEFLKDFLHRLLFPFRKSLFLKVTLSKISVNMYMYKISFSINFSGEYLTTHFLMQTISILLTFHLKENLVFHLASTKPLNL